MFIIRPDIEAELQTKTVNSMKEMFERHNAKSLELEDMGQKELAYEVKKFNNGHYFLFTVELEDFSAIDEFNRLASISDNIIRHLIVKIDN